MASLVGLQLIVPLIMCHEICEASVGFADFL